MQALQTEQAQDTSGANPEQITTKPPLEMEQTQDTSGVNPEQSVPIRVLAAEMAKLFQKAESTVRMAIIRTGLTVKVGRLSYVDRDAAIAVLREKWGTPQGSSLTISEDGGTLGEMEDRSNGQSDESLNLKNSGDEAEQEFQNVQNEASEEAMNLAVMANLGKGASAAALEIGAEKAGYAAAQTNLRTKWTQDRLQSHQSQIDRNLQVLASLQGQQKAVAERVKASTGKTSKKKTTGLSPEEMVKNAMEKWGITI